ncbi:MAG: DUF3368 domain-containing protein [Nitrospira sp.]|nr:DUF3368 domain-containing protein [Nitrospira sp.]
MILVLDASPLITLARIGSLELLHRLASQVLVPEAVYHECVTRAQGRPGGIELAQADWMIRKQVKNQAKVMQLQARVGRGEAEAIALAQEIHADAVVLDDATARQMAEGEGCRVVGLLGLLLEGKRRGLIPGVQPLLDHIRTAGFFVSEGLYTNILRQAGEGSQD